MNAASVPNNLYPDKKCKDCRFNYYDKNRYF